MLKNVLKFSVLAALIALIGVGLIYGIDYVRYRTSEEYRARQYLKELEKQYAEDQYGGDTPEETLRLFIDALKKEDTDLAAKYFVLDKQEEWRKSLTILEEKKLIDEMVKDLETAKRGKDISSKWAQFGLADKNNHEVGIVSIIKAPNNKWKISDL